MSKIDSDFELFQLIKSLSKNEKGYYKKQTKLSGSVSKKYLLLFDMFDKMSEYDSIHLKQLIANNKINNQYRVLKSYLIKSILLSLRNYHRQDNEVLKLMSSLQDVEMLAQKGLYETALTILQKTIQLCNENNLDAWIYYLLQYEIALTELSGKRPAINRLNDAEALFTKTTTKMHDEEIYFANYLNTSKIVTTLGVKPSNNSNIALQKIARIAQLSDEFARPDGLSFIYHSFTRFTYLGNTSSLEDTLNECKILVNFFIQNTEYIKLYPGYYINAIHNLSNCYYCMGNYKMMLSTIEEIANYKERIDNANESIIRLAFERELKLKLMYYFTTGAFKDASLYISKITKKVESHAMLLSADSINGFYFAFTRIFFLNGEYKKSVIWANKLLLKEHDTVRRDYRIYTKFLLLLTHYELKKYDTIKYISKYLKKEKLNDFEYTILNYFNLFFSQHSNKKEQYHTIQKIRQLLNESEYYQTTFRHYFNVANYLKKYT